MCVGIPLKVAEQVLKELPHCTQLTELGLELKLPCSDEVRHVTLYSIHQQYKALLYICTCSKVGRLCMYSQQGQLCKGLPHCTPLRELELELFDTNLCIVV